MPIGNSLKIAVDACCWSNRRGFGRFTRELLNALVAIDDINHYIFFADSATAAVSQFPPGVERVVVPTRVSPTQAASAAGHRSLADLWNMMRAVQRHDFSLFFFPAVYSYFPIAKRCKIIVTVHDLIASRHPRLTFPNKKSQWLWNIKQNLAVYQAHTLCTVSHYSRQQIAPYYRVPEERIKVISEGPGEAFVVLPHDDNMQRLLAYYHVHDQQFLLYVGGISPHKNLPALIAAYAKLRRLPVFAGIKLLLAGDYSGDSFHSDYANLRQHIQRLGLEQDVIFTGFVEDSELAYLYNAATALVFPSLEEGFGLPAVEAMACGTPVIASNRGSLPEILADAGHFFDPENIDAIAQAIEDVLGNKDKRRIMSQRGLQRARQFTWEVAAWQTLDIFRQVIMETLP